MLQKPKTKVFMFGNRNKITADIRCSETGPVDVPMKQYRRRGNEKLVKGEITGLSPMPAEA